METARFGVIGLGYTGKIHVLNLLDMPGARLTSMADPSDDRYGELEKAVAEKNDPKGMDIFSKARRFTSAAELLSSGDMDAVVVCLPTHLHEETTLSAFECGLHVLCEKPIALNLESADRMIEASSKASRCFMVGHCLRFWPEYIYLRNTIAKGNMGKLLSLNMWRLSGKPLWSWEGWFLDPDRSGGPMLDLLIHDVDFALFIQGRPDQILATGRSSADSGTFDIVHTLYEYTKGPQVHLYGGWSTAPVPFGAGYEAWLEGGFIRHRCPGDPSLEIYEKGKDNPVPAEVPPWDAYQEELRYFLACVRTRTEPELCSPSSSRDALALVLTGMESAQTRKTVPGDKLL